jgi:PKD repeat protein
MRTGRRRRGDGVRLRSKTLLAVLTALAMIGGLSVVPVAEAQKVANPGPLNFKIVGGRAIVGKQDVDLTPKPFTQCNDGINNDTDGDNAPQDTLIDFPADPECTSLDDDSEVKAGFQPKQDTVINGTVDSAGVIAVPQSGVFFPPQYIWSAANGVLLIQIQPTSPVAGTINPLTGQVVLTQISIRFKIEDEAGQLGSSCYVTPIHLGSTPVISQQPAAPMTTGTTNPPGPNTPITGVPYDPATGQATIVNNSFYVPGASGCALFGLGNSSINESFGIPAAAGTNTMIMVLESTPKIQKGVNASFTSNKTWGVAPVSVSFNGSGSTAVKGISSYAWDFGNGQTASGPTTFTTFTTPGTYDVKLTVTDPDGDKDTMIRQILVTDGSNIAPTANIASSGTGGQAPYTVSFDGTGSADIDGTIVSYAWDFGNGRTSISPTPTTTYTASGTYTVTLTVTDDRGDTATATRQIVVTAPPNLPPSASIQVLSFAGTIPTTVSFSGAGSTDPDGTIASYAWNFGNGTTGTGAAAQAVYNEAGIYTVTLTVTDNDGATATTSTEIEISADPNLPPNPSITSDTTSGTGPLVVTFDGSASTDADGSIATYAWSFGNGQFGTGPTPPPTTYNLPGTYTVTLVVTDNRGAKGTLTRTITVTPPPNIAPTLNVTAEPTTGTVPLLVRLSSAGSSDPDGAITSYSWNFGNGQTSTAPNPTPTFSTAGSYLVTLTATDNGGATSIRSVTINALPPNEPPVPVISASPLTGPAPLTVNFNGANSEDPDGAIMSYAWDFGNGQTATTPIASTTYATAGTYQARLTVTDDRGTARTTSVTIVAGTVNVRPVALLTALPTSGAAPLPVQFSSVGSYDPDGLVVAYEWSFGDGRTATTPTSSVTYSTPGTYTVSLTVTDNRGGKSTVTEQVVVDPPQVIRDRVRLQFFGALTYGFDGPINSGDLSVATDFFGVTRVSGSASYGSGGAVSVNLSRFLWFNAYSGSVTVNHPSSGVNNLVGNAVLTSLSRPSLTSVRGTVSGLTPTLQSFGLSFTIDDRA